MQWKVRQKWPRRVVEDIYRQFKIPLSSDFRLRLEQELSTHKRYRSDHVYSLEKYGMSKEWIYEQLKEVFEAYGIER